MTKVLEVNCPQCQKKVKWAPEERFRPFCSERCQSIDLGSWANEEYRLPSNEETEDWSSQDQFESDSRPPTLQ